MMAAPSPPAMPASPTRFPAPSPKVLGSLLAKLSSAKEKCVITAHPDQVRQTPLRQQSEPPPQHAPASAKASTQSLCGKVDTSASKSVSASNIVGCPPLAG